MRLSDQATLLMRRPNKVVYRDGDRVIKVFDKEKPSYDVFNEALNISRIEACGVRLTGVIEVSQVEGGEHDGAWALANRYIPGQSLRTLLLEQPERVEELLGRFVDFQASVQEARSPQLVRQKDKLSRMVAATRGTLDASMRYELHRRIDGMRIEDRVCHGDYVPSNVIVGEDGELYLCDWSHVTAGIPEIDAAMTYLLLTMNYPDFARSYLELWCTKTDTARQIVKHWLPVVAAAELSRGREQHRAYLLSFLDVEE